jgi:hypothetical protein
MTNQHLWEESHPYYATPGNYYQPYSEAHKEFDSWESFADSLSKYSPNEKMLEDKGNWLYDGDEDLNLLWRWDWKRYDHNDENDDYYGSKEECHVCAGEEDICHELSLFYMLQRKASVCSASVFVTEEDEPAIREWLIKRSSVIKSIWSPLL